MRYAREVGPGDSGMRISLRRRLAEGGYGDVLGVLSSWESGVVTVIRADGTVVAIDASDVVATRRIPPAPARR
ncbi:MAG: hypothetical protein NVS3B26_11300 [Mycobacteriales bacterium]